MYRELKLQIKRHHISCKKHQEAFRRSIDSRQTKIVIAEKSSSRSHSSCSYSKVDTAQQQTQITVYVPTCSEKVRFLEQGSEFQ
jgi:hypothetical protein